MGAGMGVGLGMAMANAMGWHVRQGVQGVRPLGRPPAGSPAAAAPPPPPVEQPSGNIARGGETKGPFSPRRHGKNGGLSAR